MVLRDLGLEKSTRVVTLVAKRLKSKELLLLAGAKPLSAEDTTLDTSVTMRVNYLSLDCPDLSFAAGPPTRRMKKSHDEGPRETQTCWTPLERATGWSNRVGTINLA